MALYRGNDSGPFAYLQAARQHTHRAMGMDLEETAAARTYKSKLPLYKQALSDAVGGPVDALLSPPSDHSWQSQPYREALAVRFPNADDLTARFARVGSERAGHDASFEQVMASMIYQPTGREKAYGGSSL